MTQEEKYGKELYLTIILLNDNKSIYFSISSGSFSTINLTQILPINMKLYETNWIYMTPRFIWQWPLKCKSAKITIRNLYIGNLNWLIGIKYQRLISLKFLQDNYFNYDKSNFNWRICLHFKTISWSIYFLKQYIYFRTNKNASHWWNDECKATIKEVKWAFNKYKKHIEFQKI